MLPLSEKTRKTRLRRHYWWTAGGALVGLLALAWVFVRVDFRELLANLRDADIGYLVLIPVVVALQELIRAWKWRQLLHPVKPVGSIRLFGAIMASYLANLIAPFGLSPFVRSWLVAHLEHLKMSTVLATVAIDRLIDGIVFNGLVALVVLLSLYPDPTGEIRFGLLVAGSASLIVFVLLLFTLASNKRRLADLAGWTKWLVERLPARLAQRIQGLFHAFALGIVWPRASWRRYGVVLASIAIKLVAAMNFLWAGLAFGVYLEPADYLFLIVFLGFVHVLAHFAHVPGGFIVGAVFALGLFGVAETEALAMALAVQASSLVSVAFIGATALWREGVMLADLRTSNVGDDR